jgi:hypothetical protein
MEERRAQFDLSMRLHALLTTMTYDVDRINALREALDARAAKLPGGDALAGRLKSVSAKADEFRKKIVATKEGGMITGEERLRENLVDLYSQVAFYEGTPSQTQKERTDGIGRELDDVMKDFEGWASKELVDVGRVLSEKHLDPVTMLSREEWEKRDTQK